MLTGRMLFDAPTVSDTLALVLTRTTELADVPARFRELLARCLEKDARKRLRDIGDARILLDARPETTAVAAPRRSKLAWGLGALAAACALAAVGLAWTHFRETAPPDTPVRLEISMPEKVLLRNALAVSPDGRQIAFSAGPPGGAPPTLWVRPLDSLQARPLAGTDWPGNWISWSPDSRKLLFKSLGAVRRIDAAGGPAESLCANCADPYSKGAWSLDGMIVMSTANGIVRLSGGGPVQVIAPDVASRRVAVLRDGKHFLYGRSVVGDQKGEIYLGTFGAPPGPELPPIMTASFGFFELTEDERQSYIVFGRQNALLAQKFDRAKLTVEGEPVVLANSAAAFAASPSVLAYRAGEFQSLNSRLVWRDRQGKAVGSMGEDGAFGSLAVSPDGKSIAVDRSDTNGVSHMWLGDVGRGVFTRAGTATAAELSPAIGPDGTVAFTFSPDGPPRDIYVVPGGAGAPEKRVQSSNVKHPNHISADGRYLMYDEHNGAQRQDLWVLPLKAGARPISFVAGPADETYGQFSPDSRWVAYASDESGRYEVYVRAFLPDQVPAAGSRKWIVSTAGGDKPRWSRNGKELFYLAADGKMMAVPIKGGEGFEPGNPVALFATRTAGYLPYDVSPDGRFLINTPVDEGTTAANTITVVMNWTSLFRK
jgi:eukaryotic-like serine/threonine-protein kinase